MTDTSLSQSTSLLHQKLGDILTLFSKAGILVVESRIYYNAVDLVVNAPLENSVFREIYEKLFKEHGLLVFQLKTTPPIIRVVVYEKTTPRLTRYKWLLAIITVITVFLTGLGLSESLENLQSIIGYNILYIDKYTTSILYATLFLLVLLSHELGHIYVNRHTGIRSEGPILIPAPPIQLGFIGTFGAVIFTKTPPCCRKDLAKLGVSGPLTGFITGTLVGLMGLFLSPVIPLEIAEKLIREGVITRISISNLALELLLRLRPVHGVLVIHPLLFITYVIYMVTFLNLLPIGQLDGGHIARSIMSARKHRLLGFLVSIILLVLGFLLIVFGEAGYFYLSLGLLVTFLQLIVNRNPHPGAADQYDNSQCKFCLLAYIVLLILTTPVPVF